MYLISDNHDTLTGMRLAGIAGVVINTADELVAELTKILTNNEYGIILITEKLSKMAPGFIDEIKLTKRLPLIAVIPDRHGSGRSPDFIMSYVRDAIGVKL